VEWSERAADEAMRSGAYEEAARWYTTALDHGGSALDDVERARLWLRVQAAEVAAGQHRRAFGAGEQAVRLARHDARPELVAAAALGCEPLGDTSSDRTLRNWCVEALAACVEPAQRARLLARLAQTQVYTGGSDEAPRTADQAIELAEASGDDEALVAGLRARQLALSGVEHTATRLDVARRMTEVGERLRRPEVEMWGRLWRIDALWESGDLAAVAAELGQLAWSVEQQHNPIARWHLLRGRAALSQARGEFAEAIARATEAFEILSAADHPGAFGGFVALLGAVGHHTGAVAAPSGVGPHLPPPDPDAVVAELFGNIGPAYALAEAGQLERAEQFYLRAGPPMGWRIPPYFALTAPYVGGYAAMHLGRLDDVAWAREQLLPWRGRHVVGGAGTGAYHGPVELALGVFAAAVDDLAAAEADLLAAVDIAARIGAPAVGVEAAVELATVELRLGRREPALSRLRRVRSAAGNLGMKPWVVRIDEALTETTDPLTPREREVARLVAKGHSNRDIASALVLSERTAANHVQHILTKLGFANRSQIAAWVAANE
jgi:DNA-binding CsgD family transcriptional regulator